MKNKSVTSNLAWKSLSSRKEYARRKEPWESAELNKAIKAITTEFSLRGGYHWWVFQILCQSLQTAKAGSLLAKSIFKSSSCIAEWKLWVHSFFKSNTLFNKNKRNDNSYLESIFHILTDTAMQKNIMIYLNVFWDLWPHYRQQGNSPITLKFFLWWIYSLLIFNMYANCMGFSNNVFLDSSYLVFYHNFCSQDTQ